MLDQMIAARNDKACVLISLIGKHADVELQPKKTQFMTAGEPLIEFRDYQVLACDGHSVTLQDITRERRITEPLENVRICPTRTGKARKLIFVNPSHDQF